MPVSRRSLLAAAGTTLAAAASSPRASASEPDEVAALVDRSAKAHAALMRGDVATYRTLIAYTDDFTLMTPFGGPPTHARDLTDGAIDAMARFFRNGIFTQDVVATYAAHDQIVLVLIERQHVEVGGLPAQDWPLRVTLVYRREGGAWRLAHRHADPLVPPVALPVAAALARGAIAVP